jgi:hypothetical protein
MKEIKNIFSRMRSIMGLYKQRKLKKAVLRRLTDSILGMLTIILLPLTISMLANLLGNYFPSDLQGVQCLIGIMSVFIASILLLQWLLDLTK